MLSTKYLVVVIICISIFNGAYGHGVLHVDNVYSSANRQIVIDNLVSTAAITTTTETQQVEFKQHASLAMAAPELTLAGSYLSVVAQNDVKFSSEDDTIELAGGHNFDTNSRTLSLLGDEVLLQSAGQINLLSRDQVGFFGRDVNFLAGDGGINFSSESGPILVSTNGTLSFSSSTGLSIEATRDITLRTEETLTADVSTGFTNFYSQGKIELTSGDDITFTSISAYLSLEADQFYLAADNYTSIGTNAEIISGTDDVTINGFERVLLDAGSIEIYGDGAGTRWISQFGGIELNSLNGNIHFVSNSASDDSRVVAEADTMYAETNDDFTITALTAIRFTSDYDIDLALDRTVAVTTRRDTYVRSESEISYAASTNFATTAETLIFTTMDEATSNESHGLIELSALLPTFDVETLFGISAASFQISARNTVGVTATDDLTILADYSDGTSQQLAINAGIFTMSSGNLLVEGGDIALSGSSATFKTTTDLTINADKEQSSYLDFSSKTNRWTAQSFDHSAGDSLIQSDADTSISAGGKTSFTTSRIHDISLVLDAFTATAGKDINTQVGGDLTILTEGLASFSSAADSRVNSEDFFSTNYRFTIFSSSLTLSTDDLVITTDRNEETNDYLHFVFSENGDFTINNLVYVSGEETQFLSNGQTYNAQSVTLSSDDMEPISFNVGSSLIEASDDLTIRGNRIGFSAFDTLDFNAASFEIEAESNGVYVESDGFISLSVNGDFNVYTVDELRVTSVGNYDHTTDDAVITFDELSYLHSDQGTIALNGATVSFFNRDNVTVASGNSMEDKIDIDVTGSLTFFGPSQKYISLSTPDGPTTITASGATGVPTSVIVNSFSQTSGELTSFSASTSYAFNAKSVYSEGGDITIQSVDADIEINASAGSIIEFRNLASSLASEEFYDVDDTLHFHSTSGSIAFVDTLSADASFDAAGSVHITTLPSNNPGRVNYVSQSADVIFQSVSSDDQTPFDHENYDISFTSGGDFIMNLFTDATIDSNGDFMIHADQAITFTQQNFAASIWDDFTIKSDLGSVFVDHTGTSIQIGTNNVDIPTLERENTIQFDSVQRMSVYANEGISFEVFEYGTTRRDVEGNSNIEQEWDQPSAFSLRTYDPQGDFIVHAQNDVISIDVFGTTLFDTDASALIETHREQYWQNEDAFSMEATDGSVFIYGADGIDTDVGVNTFFLSSRYTDFIADNLFDATANLDFFITSYHGDISFANYESNLMSWESGGYTKITGGSELNVVAQGDISFTAGDDIALTGDRGFYLTTTGQEISLTGSTFGSTVKSSEEINILAGGDLYLTNQGNTAEDMKFTGDGVVFQTVAGDITFTAGNNAEITSEIILINAFGTSSTGRDAAQFQSGADTTFQTDGEIRINANNLVDLGEDLNPPVITFSAADVSFLSQGNYEMKVDGQLSVSTVAGRNSLSSISSTTFTTGTELTATSATGDINVQALHGSVGIVAQVDFDEFFEDTFVITSEGLTTFTTGFIDATATSFTSYADFLQKISVGTDFTVNGATDGAITTRFNPTDEIVLSAATGTMNPSTDFIWSAINNINLYLGATTFDIAGGNTVFTAHNDNSDIVIGAGSSFSATAEGDLIFESLSVDFDVNLRPNVARGDFVATVLGDYVNGADSFLFETNGEYTVTAPVATSTADDYFRVLAVKDVTLTSTTLLDVDTENTYIGTRPYIAGDAPYSHDLIWTSTDYTINANGDASFTAAEIEITATGTHAWEAGSITVNNFGIDSDTTFTSVGKYTISPSNSLNVYTGAQTGRGSLELLANDITTISDTLDISAAVQDSTQPTANLFIGANEDILFTGDTLEVVAFADAVEQQGTILFDTTGLNTFESDTLTFTSTNAGFNSQSKTSLTISATTSMSTLTHGLVAGIDLFGKTLAPITTTTFTSTAGIDHLITATNNNIDLVAARLTVTSDGKASNDDAGIQFRTDYDLGAIAVLTTTSVFDTNGSFDVHATDSIVSSSSAATSITSKYASFKTVGLGNNLNNSPDQPVGIKITADTMDFDSNNEDLSFTATGTVTTTYGTAATFEGDSTYFTAHGTVQLDVTALTHTVDTANINFIAHTNGITFADETAAIAINAIDVAMNTGLLEESATFRVTSPNILFTSVGPNTLSSDNNALFQSEALTTVSSGASMYIDATKGDILFRSIDSPADAISHSLTFSAPSIDMTAYYRIEHRQHENLAFFTPLGQPGNTAGARTTPYFPRQGTTANYQGQGPFVNGCICDTNNSIYCGNIGCPSVTKRLAQMQAALEAYGLLYYN